MKSFAEIKWREFFIEEIAWILPGKDIYDSERIDGNIPLTSSTFRNNGIGYFVENINDTLEKGCLSVNRTGSVGYAFYHPYKALYSNNCRKLKLRNGKKSKYIGLFIANQITLQKEKYRYGYIMGTERLRRQKILLPVMEDGEPDYEYMDQFMRKMEVMLVEKYIDYVKREIGAPVEALFQKTWKEFFIKDIFNEIKRGKRLKSEVHIPGNTPYISSTSLNNGVDDFIGNTENVREFFDCLTLANSGSVGTCFYHPYKFVASDHVTGLRAPDASKNSYLFIAAVLSHLKDKYSFNREINDCRIQREKLFLPSDESGNPDYNYMDRYMKNIQLKQLKSYLEYKNTNKD